MMKRSSMNAFKRILGLILVLIYISGCSRLDDVMNSSTKTTSATNIAQSPTTTSSDTPAPTLTIPLEGTPPSGQGTDPEPSQQTKNAIVLGAKVTPGSCQLSQVTQPPRPVKTFSPNELDTEAGLHVTGILQWIDLETYRLTVSGLVNRPLSLTYDEIRCMPEVTDNSELVCPGVFTDYATWTGVPIKYILELAGIQEDASELTLVSADGYEVNLPIETASADNNFLAYEVNGKTLPVQHGFPIRAVFPSMWGSYWLKWLVEIRIS